MILGDGLNPFNLSREFIIPEEFSLGNAYPNPFNPVTKIDFGIPIESHVTIKIYDMHGREVRTLVYGNMQPGFHSTVWQASSFSSGAYFVKMEAKNYLKTQKIVLVK